MGQCQSSRAVLGRGSTKGKFKVDQQDSDSTKTFGTATANHSQPFFPPMDGSTTTKRPHKINSADGILKVSKKSKRRGSKASLTPFRRSSRSRSSSTNQEPFAIPCPDEGCEGVFRLPDDDVPRDGSGRMLRRGSSWSALGDFFELGLLDCSSGRQSFGGGEIADASWGELDPAESSAHRLDNPRLF